MRPPRGITVVVAVALFAAGCGGSNATSHAPTGSTQPPATWTAPAPATATAAGTAPVTRTATATPMPLFTPTAPPVGTRHLAGPVYAVGDDSSHQTDVPAG